MFNPAGLVGIATKPEDEEPIEEEKEEPSDDGEDIPVSDFISRLAEESGWDMDSLQDHTDEILEALNEAGYTEEEIDSTLEEENSEDDVDDSHKVSTLAVLLRDMPF